MRIFLLSIYAQIFLNAYILWRGYQALPPKRIVRIPFILFFVFELLLYSFGYIFYKDLPDGILYPIMMICNTWFIASIYIGLGIIGLDLVRLSNHIHPWYPEIVKKKWTSIKVILFFVFVFSVIGLMIKAYHNAMYPEVRHVNIQCSKKVEGKDHLTIGLISDLHIGGSVGKKSVQRFVALCNAEHLDMVVIAGDIIDYESLSAEKNHIEEDLQQLQAPLGVYITLGNHEYRANRYAKLRWLNQTGGILLVDSVAMPDSTFYLIGRDDVINRNRASMESLMVGLDLTKPVIVIDHQPKYVEDIIKNQCDLGLFGHTHNGQYWPAPLFLKFILKYPYGYFKKDDTHIYVSSGIGFAGPPYRIGTRSELVVLHVTFANEQSF